MQIKVAKSPKGVIMIAFGETKVALSLAETKVLLLELTKLLLPQAIAEPGPEIKAGKLATRIKSAEDLGIQKLLRVADHDDLLVLLKFGEKDEALTAKIYGNMTAKSRQIYAEDLAVRFTEGVPDHQLEKATARISAVVRQLEEEGTL